MIIWYTPEWNSISQLIIAEYSWVVVSQFHLKRTILQWKSTETKVLEIWILFIKLSVCVLICLSYNENKNNSYEKHYKQQCQEK